MELLSLCGLGNLHVDSMGLKSKNSSSTLFSVEVQIKLYYSSLEDRERKMYVSCKVPHPNNRGTTVLHKVMEY